MPVLSSALDELTAMVKATWTDVTTIGRATQSVRQNWQNAIETLQAQGKMIGIISHVDNLKERIPVQIQVLKRSNGVSVVEIN